MAIETFQIGFLGPYGLLEALENQLMERYGILKLQVSPDPHSMGTVVTVEVRDHGIWEWNEEVIKDEEVNNV